MGKKSTVSSGKTQKAPPEEVTNNGLVGVFPTDFLELLERQGLPHVEIRNLHKNEPVLESYDAPEDPCLPVLASHFPLLVDFEDAEDPSTLKSLHIRSWLLSERVLSVMTEALASCSRLTSISLWNVGLTKHTLQQISQLIIQQNIKQVILDGNTMCSASVLDLIGPRSSVEHLSMKCCGISDAFLAEVTVQLAENKSLVYLNLSCNRIGDDGVNSLAASLRLNRTLLSLALTNNHIGDAGALSLSNVLSRFELNHSEIVLRRKLLSLLERSEDGMSLADLDKTKETGVRRSPSVSSVDTKGRGTISKEKGQSSKGASKKADTKKEEKGKKDDKPKKGPESKRNKGKDSKASKKVADTPAESPKPEPLETLNPLLDVPLEKEQDKLFIPGNTTLAYLTLAFNRIGEDGVHAFLDMLKVQQQYSQLGRGLLNLSLHHNLTSDKTPDMLELNELLARKNPLQSIRCDSQVPIDSN